MMTSLLLLLLVLMSLCGVSFSMKLNMMSESEMKNLNKAGASDFNFIMNLVLMGMSEDMTQNTQKELSIKFGTAAQQDQGSDPTNSNAPIQIDGRRKRAFNDPFFGDFNNGGNTGTTNDNTNDDGTYISYPEPGSSSSSSDPFDSKLNNFEFDWGRRLTCPRQVDQGRVFVYDADPETYPTVEIGQELFVRSLPGSDLLFQSLSRSVVFPTDPPEIFTDPFLSQANATCPTDEDQIWSYNSIIFTGRCYPLVNFQETPYFSTCLNRYCNSCKSSHNFFQYTANICVTEYRQVSLFSYCESLLPNRRIVKDRILAPVSCACTTVNCKDSWRTNWR